MTKEFQLEVVNTNSLGTADRIYKVGTPVAIVTNTGKTPIRIDKEMLQVSAHNTCAAGACMIGVVLHISDETGATFDGGTAIVDGTTTIDALQGLLNQWKDNVFATDFQWIGQTVGQNAMWSTNMEPNTQRLLGPGQALYVSIFAMPSSTETSKGMKALIDNIVWYSPAAAK